MKFGVIGDPVAQSPSPKMFAAAFQALGLNATYDEFLVKSAELPFYADKVRQNELQGFNVTIPHKESIMTFLDGLTDVAIHIGAVNTVCHRDGKAIGYNTDGSGYLQSLREAFTPNLEKMSVTVLGAGGAALAIVHTLCESGVRDLHLVNRDEARAKKIMQALAQYHPSTKADIFSWVDFAGVLPKTDLLINATPLGMKGKQDWRDLAFLQRLPKTAIVSDIVANPIATGLLREAKKSGLKTLPGYGMLLHQGVEAFEIFTGKKPDVSAMQGALLEVLS